MYGLSERKVRPMGDAFARAIGALACLALLPGFVPALADDDPYPEIQPSTRTQAIDVLSRDQPTWPSLTAAIHRARGATGPVEISTLRALSLVARRSTPAEERVLTTPDGTLIGFTLSSTSPDRIDDRDENGDGVPDVIDAVLVGLAQARELLADRFELPAPAQLEVVLTELGDRVEGYLVPAPAEAVRRRIVLDGTPQTGVDSVRRAAIREYTHAVAQSAGGRFPIEWAEALATWAVLTVDGAPDDRTEGILSRRIDRLSEGLVTDDLELAAGNALWLSFVEEFYGPTAVRLTFEELAQGHPVAPALDRAVRRIGADDLDAAFAEFHLWTILVGELSDRHHFPYADRLWAPRFRTPSAGLPALSVQTDPALAPLGATQVRIVPDHERGGLRIGFDGEFGVRWGTDLILRFDDGVTQRVSMALTEGRGDFTLPLESVAEAWLLIRNLGGDDEAPGRYTYTAHHDKAFPFELTSFSAETESGGVAVAWETASEQQMFGFNILRTRESGGRQVTVNPIWIPALGLDGEATSYRFLDLGAEPGVAYQYRIEGITVDGLTSRSEPLTVRPPSAPRKTR